MQHFCLESCIVHGIVLPKFNCCFEAYSNCVSRLSLTQSLNYFSCSSLTPVLFLNVLLQVLESGTVFWNGLQSSHYCGNITCFFLFDIFVLITSKDHLNLFGVRCFTTNSCSFNYWFSMFVTE